MEVTTGLYSARLKGAERSAAYRPGGAVLLLLLQAIGLARAAHATAGAGHDLDQVIVGVARIDLL